MFPDFATRPEFARPVHPGTVTFIGADGTERVDRAEYIPDWLKFAPGPDGSPIPVVRIVRIPSDRGYSLRSYGSDGQLLWVGLTVPSGPPVNPTRPEIAFSEPRSAPSRPLFGARRSTRDLAPAAESTGWF